VIFFIYLHQHYLQEYHQNFHLFVFSVFLSCMVTSCFSNPDYRLIRMTSPPNYSGFEGYTLYLYHSWPRQLMEVSGQLHAPVASPPEKGPPVLIGRESIYGRIFLRRVLKKMVYVSWLISIVSGQSPNSDSCVIMINLWVWDCSHLGYKILHSCKWIPAFQRKIMIRS
jgi:hypothetical protein